MLTREEHLDRLEAARTKYSTLPDDATLVLLRVENLLIEQNRLLAEQHPPEKPQTRKR